MYMVDVMEMCRQGPKTSIARKLQKKSRLRMLWRLWRFFELGFRALR